MPGRKKLITADEAVEAKKQHRTCCFDCPWARTSLAGWLGGETVEIWLRAVSSSQQIDCHTLLGAQCAGAAVYRANCGRRNRPGDTNLELPLDRKKVFASPMEFSAHHSTGLAAYAAEDA